MIIWLHLKFKIYNAIVPKLVTISKLIVVLFIALAFNIPFDTAYATNNQTLLVKKNIEKLIKAAESKYLIPSGLLLAIANIESNTFPYALNIRGKAFIVDSRAKAAILVRRYLSHGVTNIDIGVMQVNFHCHGKNFTSIEQMLEPKSNIDYAARLLTGLYHKYGSWSTAVRYYHSALGLYQEKYALKVQIAWFKNR